MISVEYSYTVNASPAKVFSFISNPENEVLWENSCIEAQLASQDTIQIGSNYSITFNFLSRKMKFQATIIEFVPSQRFAFQTLSGPLSYEGRYRFSPHNGGTHVDFRFDAEPKAFFGIIPLSLVRKVFINQIERDVKKLKELLEQA